MRKDRWISLKENQNKGVSLAVVLCVSAFFIAFSAAILYTAGLLTSQSTRRLEQERSYLLASSYGELLDTELEKKAADDGSLHFTLTGYETTVTGSYTGTNGTGNYSMDLSAELTAVRDADTESWSYELKLPDAVRVTAKDGSAVEAVRLTKKVTLQADVRDNLEEPLSEAYVESEQAEISFQQE